VTIVAPQGIEIEFVADLEGVKTPTADGSSLGATAIVWDSLVGAHALEASV